MGSDGASPDQTTRCGPDRGEQEQSEPRVGLDRVKQACLRRGAVGRRGTLWPEARKGAVG